MGFLYIFQNLLAIKYDEIIKAAKRIKRIKEEFPDIRSPWSLSKRCSMA